jgi:hypothetical protein
LLCPQDILINKDKAMPTPEEYAVKKLNSILGNQPTILNTDTGKPSSKPGPNTEAGKARSSMNATRHGLSGRVVVLPSEDMNLYLKFSKDFVDSLTPQTPMENEIAQAIADGYWRMKRVRTTEESLYALGHYEGQGDFDANHEEVHAAFTAGKTFRDHSHAFVNLSIYEQRIQRGIDRNTRLLRELQTERKERRKAEMAEVLRLRDYHEMMSHSRNTADTRSSNGELIPAEPTQRYEPLVDGFVYASAEIEVEAQRRDRRKEAWEAAKASFNYAEFQKKAA